MNMEPRCQRCGDCCNTYSFWMGNRSFDDDPLGIKRLIEYHNCIPMKNAKGELGIKIPMTCIHLQMEDGKSSCAIHDDKPEVCKRYYCGKALRAGIEKVNGIHI